MALSSSSPVVAPSPCRFLCPRATTASHDLLSFATTATRRRLLLSTATTTIAAAMAASSSCKVIDSHLHVWATPQQVRKQATRASPVSASWAPGGPRGSSVILLGLFFFFLPVTPTLSVQAKEEYPYFPGQEPTLRGDADFLLEVSQRTSEMPHSFALEVALEPIRFRVSDHRRPNELCPCS
jgi:hypothetical protein